MRRELGFSSREHYFSILSPLTEIAHKETPLFSKCFLRLNVIKHGNRHNEERCET